MRDEAGEGSGVRVTGLVEDIGVFFSLGKCNSFTVYDKTFPISGLLLPFSIGFHSILLKAAVCLLLG